MSNLNPIPQSLPEEIQGDEPRRMSTRKKMTKINYRKLDGREGPFTEGKLLPSFSEVEESSNLPDRAQRLR